MIPQFPYFYPDELVYSLLARYYVRSGYIKYAFAAEDLFQTKTVRPDIELVNAYTPAAARMIAKDIFMDDLILHHTMFPYYGRFLPKERRQKAFDSLVSMQGNYHNLLPMPKRKTAADRYLRFCPLCVQNDREKYGETYWHRIHQMMGVNICPVHHCRLIDSNIIIGAKVSPDLVSAEEYISSNEDMPIIYNGNETEYVIADYMAKVFQLKINFQSDVRVGDFLHSRMANTKYLSIRGEQRNIGLFHADFKEHYKSLPDNWFTELWQIQKVLTNDRVNFYEICLLALFLNIPVSELGNMNLPEQTQEQLFDEKVFLLHKQGLKYPEIAKQLNASYDVVKAVGEKRYSIYHKEHKEPLKCGIKPYDWKQIDKDTLPLVKTAIRQLKGNETVRPKRITVFAIERALKLPSGRIDYLQKCKAEILKNQESQEKYWAREVVWAVRKTQREGQKLNWRNIRNLTNMRNANFQKCKEHLHDLVDEETAETIKMLI